MPLNLIGLAQERINVHRALLIIRRCMSPQRVLAIEVDGITFQPPKKVKEQIQKQLNEVTYDAIQKAYRKDLQKWSAYLQDPMHSKALVYKCKEIG